MSSAREAKRARIVEGALSLVSRYGLKKTTIEDIASHVGLKPASVYYYFSGKEEVFAAVVRQAAEAVTTRVRAAVDGAESAEAKLMAYFQARYSYLELLEGVTESAAVELYPMAEAAFAEFEVHGKEILVEILVHGAQTGEFAVDDPEALALGMYTGMRGMDSMFIVQRLDEETMEPLLVLLHTFLHGLKAPPEGEQP